MYSAIAIKEWRMLLRTHTITVALLSAVLLLMAASIGAAKSYSIEKEQRESANNGFRQQWELQHASDAHSAAHFGTYIFKPLTPLSQFDRGLNAFAGNSMRIEAHIRHTMATPPLSPADVYLRFGELTPAAVFQLFFPLLLIFLCYNSYTQENTNGTLRLLIVQGSAIRSLLMSKTILYTALALMILFITLFICLPLVFRTGIDIRILILFGCYACYLCIFICIGMGVSAIAGDGRNALLILLGLWLCWNVLAPRMTAAIGSTLYPLPGLQAMQQAIDREIKSGINGNDPREERVSRLQQSTLAHYGVKATGELPVNFDAIRLQAEEDYAQLVYDKHAAAGDSIIQQQNAITRYAALADPYLALRSISMAVCGTDYQHHFAFDTAARNYRNDFIRKLNNAMLHDQPMDTRFFAQMPTFRYVQPSPGKALLCEWISLLSLILWLFISFLLLNFSARYAKYH